MKRGYFRCRILLALMCCSLMSCANPELDNTQIDGPPRSTKTATEPPAVNPQVLITHKSVGRALIGMTLMSLREAYPECTFEEAPVHEYGIDGESTGLLLKKEGRPFLFAWTPDGEQTIKGIVAISDELTTRSGYRVGMTSQEVASKCTGCEIGLDMLDSRIEFVQLPDHEDMRLEFLTTDSSRIGRYNLRDPDQKSRILLPHSKVARISIIAGQDMQ